MEKFGGVLRVSGRGGNYLNKFCLVVALFTASAPLGANAQESVASAPSGADAAQSGIGEEAARYPAGASPLSAPLSAQMSSQMSSQTSGSLSTIAPGLGARRLRGEFFHWATLKGNDMVDATGQTTVQGYVGANYKFNDREGVSIRQQFLYGYEFPKSTGANSNVQTDDVYIEYQNNRLAEFWRDAKLAIVGARLGLPTGESSRFVAKTCGWLYLWLEATKPITGKLRLNWHLRPQWYNESQNLYVNADGNSVGAKDWGFDQFPELEYRFNSVFSASHSTGTSHMWYRAGDHVPTRQDKLLSSWSALNVQATQAIALSFVISDDAELNPGNRAFGLYRSDETGYHFIMSAIF